jgi:hypothetical protein
VPESDATAAAIGRPGVRGGPGASTRVTKKSQMDIAAIAERFAAAAAVELRRSLGFDASRQPLLVLGFLLLRGKEAGGALARLVQPTRNLSR